ncbi:GNAT family N-acetyltransferase [Parapedobacter soli]|uniref:GNAT family N-acetyltransferase n=1 Tax=Parapedobacter soli TaxID=416955 RepID=UPI0021C91305|nr:GNAT family N-acetyltransferase [Parapedobacter soli]
MKQQNIDNLTSLWLLASEPFGAYRKSGSYNIVELDFSEWPNRVWQSEENAKTAIENVKEILQQCSTNHTFTKWNVLQDDEHKEAENLGLSLKSIQIGMSLNLQNYNIQSSNHHLFLVQVNNTEKAVLWSAVFQQCFGYSISSKIIEAIKDDVAFYLINDNQDTVGCVATFIKDNQIGIHSLGVLNKYRKQGIAETVMHILLHEAKNNGLVNAHLQSSMLGLGIYKKIGFEEIFKMCNYKI